MEVVGDVGSDEQRRDDHHRADQHVDPEDAADVVVVDLFLLDERGAESRVDEQLGDTDVDRRGGRDAEVARTDHAGQRDGESDAQDLLGGRRDESPAHAGYGPLRQVRRVVGADRVGFGFGLVSVHRPGSPVRIATVRDRRP